MRSEDIYNGITDIRDDQIDGADKDKITKNKGNFSLILPIAAAFILSVSAGVYMYQRGGKSGLETIRGDESQSEAVTTVNEEASMGSSDTVILTDITDNSPEEYPVEAPVLTTDYPPITNYETPPVTEPQSQSEKNTETSEPKMKETKPTETEHKETKPDDTPKTDAAKTENDPTGAVKTTERAPQSVPAEAAEPCALVEPVYPETVEYSNDMPYEKWEFYLEQQRNKAQLRDSYKYKLDHFMESAIPAVLSEAGQGKNAVCSPINAYLALSMLAEITDGESREQVLELLGADDLDEVRARASAIFTLNYCEDETFISILANSIWLNSGTKYRKNTLQALADYYFAGAYFGTMGDEAYNQMYRDWVKRSTGGFLGDDKIASLGFTPDLIMNLASTLYFNAKWDVFSESNTKPATFHSPDGDVEAQFMNTFEMMNYFWGDGYAAISLSLNNAGGMWLILPDEGVTPEELIQSGTAMDFVLNADLNSRFNNKFVEVNLSVPKFEIYNDTDFSGVLKGLGVTDVFDERADFSPVLEDENQELYLSKVQHTVRLKVDEEGIEGAALTEMSLVGAAAPTGEIIDLVYDRPFIFAVVTNGCPIFMGTVNNPVR